MNLRKKVWLPPDGDSRLLRYRDSCPLGPSGPFGPPPYVQLNEEGRAPVGPVRLGGWIVRENRVGIEALDVEGFVGVLVLGWPQPLLDAGQWPPPPTWSWTKGRLATLEMSKPLADDEFILWSWLDLRGWKAVPTRG